ncbi:restriction endonuclease subunit S [bacterium]|nr:restriction endonuclease subunit S [bacterium]
MKKEIKYEILDSHVFVTKLAGFEHSEYIQKNETRVKVKADDIPLVKGKNIKNGKFIEKYEYYISKKISDKLERSKLTKDCILVPYVGSNLGEVGVFYHNYDCQLASNIAKIELTDNHFHLEYLKYYLQSPIGQGYLFQYKQGSAQPNITMESIRQTKVADYSYEKQLEIANILKCIDDKIDTNNRINDNLYY